VRLANIKNSPDPMATQDVNTQGVVGVMATLRQLPASVAVLGCRLRGSPPNEPVCSRVRGGTSFKELGATFHIRGWPGHLDMVPFVQFW
jgi:hypothetical protein